MPTFIKWAEKADEPLRSYASGLLGASMHMSDVAGTYRYRKINVFLYKGTKFCFFRDENSRLVPIMIQRLRTLQEEYFSSLKPKEENGSVSRPFANLGDPSTPEKSAEGQKPNQGSTYINYYIFGLTKLIFF